MTLQRTARAWSAMAAWLALAACTTTPAANARAESSPQEARFLVLGSAEPRAISAADLEPTIEGAQLWTVRELGGQWHAAEIRTQSLPNGRLQRVDPFAASVLTRNADGSVVLDERTDPRDGATMRPTPPTLLAPAMLAVGQEIVAECDTRTWRGASFDGEVGSSRRVLRNAGADRVRTPLGEFDAVRVQVEFTMKVSFASIRRDTTVWVRPGFGPVATSWDEHVLVMGTTPGDRGATMVRLPERGNRQ